ncbi:MAG TPA: hypothetical protein VFY28_01450 [Candidatus Paceibacterota bacterium]|nr:hypothetical protein [Candidatus Paceibacterota bacterium]
MEGPPRRDTSIEDYQALLSIRIEEMANKTWRGGGTFNFSVSPESKIFIMRAFHFQIAETFGFDESETLTAGYIRVEKGTGKVLTVDFKHPDFQRNPAFKKSARDLANFQAAVRSKIEAVTGPSGNP